MDNNKKPTKKEFEEITNDFIKLDTDWSNEKLYQIEVINKLLENMYSGLDISFNKIQNKRG
jgi:hypothetical protein